MPFGIDGAEVGRDDFGTSGSRGCEFDDGVGGSDIGGRAA